MKKLFFLSAAVLGAMTFAVSPVLAANSVSIENAQEKKTQIKPEELPQPVKDKIAADYKDWSISAAYLYETSSQYEVDFKKGAETKTVKFDKDGNVVEK